MTYFDCVEGKMLSRVWCGNQARVNMNRFIGKSCIFFLLKPLHHSLCRNNSADSGALTPPFSACNWFVIIEFLGECFVTLRFTWALLLRIEKTIIHWDIGIRKMMVCLQTCCWFPTPLLNLKNPTLQWNYRLGDIFPCICSLTSFLGSNNIISSKANTVSCVVLIFAKCSGTSISCHNSWTRGDILFKI